MLLAGCGTDSGVNSDSQGFAEIIAEAIDEAEAGGAGEGQLAILREAQANGKVSLEDARAAARAGVACINDAGSQGFYGEHTTDSGIILPGVSSVANTPEEEAIGDACRIQENFWVNMAYQMQPSSLAVKDAYLERQAPVVRSCLEREGYAPDPSATTIELLRQAAQVQQETDWAVDCLAEAQIDGF